MELRKVRVAVVALGIGAMAAVSGGTAAQAQGVDLTMGVLPAPNSLYTRMMAQVPERISRATDGAVTVSLNDSLVGGTQITASVRDGRVPMSGALHTYLAGIIHDACIIGCEAVFPATVSRRTRA